MSPRWTTCSSGSLCSGHRCCRRRRGTDDENPRDAFLEHFSTVFQVRCPKLWRPRSKKPPEMLARSQRSLGCNDRDEPPLNSITKLEILHASCPCSCRRHRSKCPRRACVCARPRRSTNCQPDEGRCREGCDRLSRQQGDRRVSG